MAAGKKLTQEEFIVRAKEVHGDKYDYSKVVYKNAMTDICIICPEHGEFWQRAGHHLKGCGCPKCSAVNAGNDRRKTTEDFITRAKEVHGDKYDYSKVVYKTANDKVIIICPEHGKFLCKPSNHLSGKGCPKCAGKYKTTEDFVAQVKKVHGDKYDYSKIEYVNCDTKITVVCPKHGEFSINPSRFLNGFGCPKCATDKKWESKRMSTEEFIMKAKEIHGDKYDYSKTHCGKSNDKVCIICPEHGEFWQLPKLHLKGSGCPKCLGKNMTTEDFVAKLQKLYGDKYDYSKVEYVSSNTPVTIICPVHGEFQRKPVSLLNGKGETCCPKCNGTYMDTDYFIEKAREVHGDKYDYSKVVYKTNHDKVCIICPEHGEFWQSPSVHLKGGGCRKCIQSNAYMTTEEFIAKAKEVHGDKYDYSKVVYKGIGKKVCIICHEVDEIGNEHGEFWQTPQGHLSGRGCQKCVGKYKPTTEEFIAKAKHIHGDKYDYSKVEYVNGKQEVCIICPEHGEFWQLPKLHLKGSGCPNCHGLRKEYKFNLLEEFKDEYKFRAFLEKNDINILYVLLMNVVESKFDPIKKDIEKALANASEVDPIQALEDKYKSDNDEEDENEIENTKTTIDLNDIDWDDEEAVNTAINAKITAEDKEEKQPTIEDLIRNTEQEIKVINRVEHMLTPEVREYIMKKFLNDKRRLWMAERGK